ncbi:outer membrane beta-barrel protein [Aureibaculum sp. 2210JD6-5]|uniref:outer membrane beta-barrel protein n=1 Tax=Aureibaculum sp. 2210JD6-5 TaxID=3103957 RepID=UPI002AACE53B|nr:outer membrane beta-barrel protein [Aureibaculum sp. 2210JD6-5]MDY7393686.1 outer membrane beta-barrel protein [Aureibaculum sp. 2210JD6-5]
MKYLKIVVFLVFPLSILSQNNSEIFYLKSAAVSPGAYIFNKPNLDSSAGFLLNGEVAFGYKQNVFMLSVNAGEEIDLFGYNDNVQQINLMYGREFPLSNRFSVDAFAGLGYFSVKTRDYFYENSKNVIKNKRFTTMGFPISARIRYKFNDFISLGLKFEQNINSVNSVFNTGFIVQFNFIKRKR